MRKEMKPGNQYFIINMDEPYAEEIYAVLKRGQQTKGQWPEGEISFEEWKRQTFSQPVDPNKEREKAIHEFRMDELDGVMHSVDKWIPEGDPRLKNNPSTRAADAREIALQAIEKEAERTMKWRCLMLKQYEELRTWNAERGTQERWHDMLLRHQAERTKLENKR